MMEAAGVMVGALKMGSVIVFPVCELQHFLLFINSIITFSFVSFSPCAADLLLLIVQVR